MLSLSSVRRENENSITHTREMCREGLGFVCRKKERSIKVERLSCSSSSGILFIGEKEKIISMLFLLFTRGAAMASRCDVTTALKRPSQAGIFLSCSSMKIQQFLQSTIIINVLLYRLISRSYYFIRFDYIRPCEIVLCHLADDSRNVKHSS